MCDFSIRGKLTLPKYSGFAVGLSLNVDLPKHGCSKSRSRITRWQTQVFKIKRSA
jgi:hypothetical protein